jgi:hypothetical protein
LEQCFQPIFTIYKSLSIRDFASEIEAEIDILKAPYMQDFCSSLSYTCLGTI